MRILITGNGLLGSALYRIKDNYKDYNVILPEKYHWDLTNSKKAYLMIEAYKPDVIIHTAAKVGGVKLNASKPESMFYDNMSMTSHVIHFAAQAGVKKVVAFGSTCAFDGEIKEDKTQYGTPYENNLPYAYAKRMTEIHLKAAKDQYGMDYAYFVPCSMYGPGDNFNLDNGHVIPSLIHKCRLSIDSLKVWGDGSPKREIMFSEDMANIVFKLLEEKTETMVVGTNEEVSIKDIAERIVKCMNFSGEIEWESKSPSGQQKRKIVNTSKFRKFLPSFQFTCFTDGLSKTVDWFNENYPNVRM
jgi:GDP-L-fucose synthase